MNGSFVQLKVTLLFDTKSNIVFKISSARYIISEIDLIEFLSIGSGCINDQIFNALQASDTLIKKK